MRNKLPQLVNVGGLLAVMAASLVLAPVVVTTLVQISLAVVIGYYVYTNFGDEINKFLNEVRGDHVRTEDTTSRAKRTAEPVIAAAASGAAATTGERDASEHSTPVHDVSAGGDRSSDHR